MDEHRQIMSDMEPELTARLHSREARVAIIGMGYVGLPLALRFSAAGYVVTGIDIDADKVSKLEAASSYISYIPDQQLRTAREQGFTATADMAACDGADAIIICVPTPLDSHREPDLSYVTGTMDAVLPHLHRQQVVVLVSTTYPGTTEEEVAARVTAQGLAVGEDVFVVYAPEREDPDNSRYQTQNIPKVVGGITPACLQVGLALFQGVIDELVPVSSTRTAEMTKLLENIHRAVNIGLVNEMKMVADRMEIDIHEVIRAAATKPFGFVPYYPGPGLGGHCIPIDPFYLTWKAREYGVNTRFIELAGEINSAMPEWVVNKLAEGLNQHSKAIRGSRVLVLGVAYKKNVQDMRESPGMRILDLLRSRGAEADYTDPMVPRLPKLRDYQYEMESVNLTQDNIARYDAMILVTNHDAFDYPFLQQHAQLIVDTRGVYLEPAENIIRA